MTEVTNFTPVRGTDIWQPDKKYCDKIETAVRLYASFDGNKPSLQIRGQHTIATVQLTLAEARSLRDGLNHFLGE